MKESGPTPTATPRAPAAIAATLKSALRVKDLALDLATDVADGYRKSTRTFKLQALVIAAWAVLSIATIAIAWPRTGPSNALGAEVQVSEELLGTQILVWNSSGRMWTDVTLTLDGAWQWHTPTFREGQRLVIATNRFTRDGAAAPVDFRPRSLTIECAEGKVSAPLVGRAP